MICPWCNKATPKALHTQIGLIKTCEHCNNKFKVKFRIKEIIIYGLVVGALLIVFGLISGVALAASAGSYSIETNDAGVFGMGTAFVGQADTPAAVYYNPAGINQITAPEISFGDAVIAPQGAHDYTEW